MQPIGKLRWAIAEGCIPLSTGHTDSRNAELALLSTIAFSVDA